MLIKKVLVVSWLCLLWTKADSAVTEDATTQSWSSDGNLSSMNGEGKVEMIKTDSSESTVRSFFPVKGKQKWMRRSYPPAEEMLFFNVSVIGDNEEVSLAELHLHRRRIAKIHGGYHKRYLPLPYRVVLYQVQPIYKRKVNRDARTMKLASIPVSYTTKSGWHTVDVTAVLRELLINAQGPMELLLGVQFEAPKGLAKSYSPLVPLKHFLKPTGNFDPDHPYRTSSYLVVFSEIDPYYEEFEEDEEGEEDDLDETENEIPVFRERHLKHKMLRVKSTNGETEPKSEMEKNKKYKMDENEVYKSEYGRKEDVRHKSKHKMADVKRSKVDDLAIQAKNKLKLLPFLHTNEVDEIRQTSRRLARSASEGASVEPTSKDIRRILINHIKEMERSLRKNESGDGICAKREFIVRLNDLNLNVKVSGPSTIVTSHCFGSCTSGEVERCKPVFGGKPIDIAYFNSRNEMVSVRLNNLSAKECKCR